MTGKFGHEVYVDGNVESTGQGRFLGIGTAPLLVASSLLVASLNADLLDGNHGSFYLDAHNLTNKYTTLAGWGIADAWTKAEADSRYLQASWAPTLQQVLDRGNTGNKSILLQHASDSMRYLTSSGNYVTVVGSSGADGQSIIALSNNVDVWGILYQSGKAATMDEGNQLRAQQDPVHANDLARKSYIDSKTTLLAGAGANTWLGNNTGSSGTPVYNSLAALTRTNDANVTLTLGGTPATALAKSVSMTLGWTGQLAVSRGGTGLASIGSSGQLLRSNGSGLEYFTHNFISSTLIGAANGIASLDGSGKVPLSQLPVTGMQYKGTWDASSNTPSLTDGTGTEGYFFRVTVAGTQNLGSGNITFSVGDDVIHNGSVWQRAPSGATATNLALGTITGSVIPITNSNGTGFTLPAATTTLAGLLTAADKVKLNSALTSFTETDPTVPAHVKAISSGDIANWNGKENAFSKGSIIQGAGVSLSGTLTARLVGSGDITIASTAVAPNLSWSAGTGQLSISGGTGANLDGRYFRYQVGHSPDLDTEYRTGQGYWSNSSTGPKPSNYGTWMNISAYGGDFVPNNSQVITQLLFRDDMPGLRMRIRGGVGAWSSYVDFATQDWVTANTRSSSWAPTWAEVTGKPGTFAPSAHTLDSHNNVSIASPATGQILRYNAGVWENWTPDFPAGSFVTTDTAQTSGLTGQKTWSANHTWVPTGDNNATNSAIMFGLSSGNGPYIIARDASSSAFVLRTYATSGIQFALQKGGISASAAAYSSGGYGYLVRNSTSGAFETRAIGISDVTGLAGSYVDTSTNQASIAGDKGWTGNHTFTPNAGNTETNNAIMFGALSGNGPYVTLRNASVQSVVMRSYAGANNIQLLLSAGSVSINAAAYASGGYGYLVRNSISGAIESKAIEIGDVTGLQSALDGKQATISIPQNTLMGRWSSGNGSFQNVTLGPGLSLSGSGVLSSAGSGGTVTSVGLSAPTGFSVSGSPVATTGTLALSFAAGYSLPTNAKQAQWDRMEGSTINYNSAPLSNLGMGSYALWANGASVTDRPGGINSYVLHIGSYDNNAFWFQLATPYWNNDKLYTRNSSDTGVNSWRALAHEDWVAAQNYVTNSTLSGYVTIDTPQTISGSKSFTGTNKITGSAYPQLQFEASGGKNIAIYGDSRGFTFTNNTDTKYVVDIDMRAPSYSFSVSSSGSVGIGGLPVSGKLYVNGQIDTVSHGNSSQWNTAHSWVNTYGAGLQSGPYSQVGHTHATLTRGTGLTGGNYNGGSAQTWAFDTTWGDARYSQVGHAHATLTPGTGISGSGYNGSGAQTWSISFGSSAGQAAQGNDYRINNGQAAWDALGGYVPGSRRIDTSGSIQGGGDLWGDKSLSLIGDSGSPGNNKYYGTKADGQKGFWDLPSGGGGTIGGSIGSGYIPVGNGTNTITNSLLLQSGGTLSLNGGFVVNGNISCYYNIDGGYGSSFLSALVGANGSPNSNAVLELTSTNKGFLPPRMSTTDWNNISGKPEGLIAWNTSENALMWWDGYRTAIIRFNGTKYQGWTGSAWVDFH